MVNIEALLGRHLARLHEKDAVFRRRLSELQQEYGGGGRLAEELDELDAGDRAFANRIAGHGWQAFVESMQERLGEAFLEELPIVDGAGRIVFRFDLERAEISVPGRGVGGVRRPGARGGRMFGRRDVVLDLAADFDALVGGGQHTSRVYPIVFSHDGERNRRFVFAAIIIELLWPKLVEFARGAVEGIKFPAYRNMVFEVVVSSSGDVLLELVFGADEGAEDGAVLEQQVSVEQLGFVADREIARQLDEYVDVDAEANYRWFLKERQVGALERRDFVEPFGRTRSVRLDRVQCEVEVLGRERPILTIKRAVRLVDPAPLERRVEQFADERSAESGYLGEVQGLIGEGFRQVYEVVCDEGGDIVVEWGDGLFSGGGGFEQG